jgi:hypothetical protein
VKIGKPLLAIAGATMLLGMLIGSASAGRLSASSQTLRATWARATFTGPFGTSECEITLEGSFHRSTIAKVAGALTGSVYGAAVRSPCVRGAATVLRETLPWHAQYDSFVGTLPNITSIAARVIGASFQINEGFICLGRTTAERPGTLTLNREAGGRLLSVRLGGRVSTDCFLEGTMGGTSNSLSVIRVTLI